MPVRSAAVATKPSVTVVVPTFREAANLPHLLDRLAQVREQYGLVLDVRIMDDASGDGTEELIASRNEPWVELVVRSGPRGLSAAVIEGFAGARGETLVCMDADLSHSPEKIPELLASLAEGFDFVVGSRYVEGGTTADDWGLFRWLNSRVATWLARPFTAIEDPMSGFFALERATFERAAELNPIGYKIGLELIVKCRCQRVGEIPIHFSDRAYGESKLTVAQQVLYLEHLRRLSTFKFGVWSHLAQFLVVGGLGTIVNLVLLTLLLWLGASERPAVGGAIFLSMCFNFVLNRRFSFSYARAGSWWRQLVGFVLASSVGAVANYAVTVALLEWRPDLVPQVAALAGIASGTGINFVASRFLVFRAKHVRPD